MEMKKYKLQDLGTIITGKTPSTKQEDNFNGNIPFVTPEDITNNVYNLKKTGRYITEKGFASIKANTISGKSILVGCIGSDMGNVGFINSECATNQQINSITDIKSDFVPEYIYYNLCTKKEFFRKNAGSTTTPLLPKSVFSLLDIFCCDFENQQKIAAVLSSLDDKITLNNRINAKLEQMAKRLYDYWFVQFDFPRSVSGEPCLHELSRTDDGNARSDFPGADGKPYKSNGGKMVWNEELKREIPEGWEVKKLGEILILLKDGTHNPPKRQEEGIPLLTGTMFGMNFLDYDKATYISEKDYKMIHSQYEPKENDVVITKIGTLGNVNLLRNIDLPIAIHCNSAILRFDMALGVYYPFFYCKSDLFKMRLKAIKGQSIQEFASLDRISSIKSEVPCVDIINKFDKVVKPIIEKQKNVSFENEKLKAMRDKLLPLLMNGQVVVE